VAGLIQCIGIVAEESFVTVESDGYVTQTIKPQEYANGKDTK
jgi:hypothetical protein